MKNIVNVLNEAKVGKDSLPILSKLKKNPEWLTSYPDFCDKMEEIWDNDKKFFSTIMYFITKNEKINEQGWPSMKVDLTDLYHKK